MRYLSFLILLISFASNAQDMRQQIMSDFYFSPEAMKSHHNKSVHVFTEIYLNEGEETYNYIITAKSLEGEFDEEGRVIYERYITTPERSHGLGDKTTQHIKTEFGPNGKPSRICTLRDFNDDCNDLKYDQEGNITEMISYGKHSKKQTIKFTWKDGEMIKSDVMSEEENDHKTTYAYNSDGKLEKFSSSYGFKYDYEYKEIGDRSQTILKSYRDDSLTGIRIIEIDTTSKLYTEYLQINGNLDTTSHVKAEYDEYHNLTRLVEVDYTEVLHFDKYGPEATPPPAPVQLNREESVTIKQPKQERPKPRTTIFSSENKYENGLIVKRTLSAKDISGRIDDEFHFVQRFIYEDQPLKIQSWPENEEEW